MNNTFYAPNDYRSYLEHFGIKGMKWGVRRYRNYDGSYTQAGLKRYNVTERRYDDMAAKAKQAKADYKAGKITKLDYNRAKNARREAERDLKTDFKRLRNDKRADKGKELYVNGKRIRSPLGTYVSTQIGNAMAYGILRGSGHEKLANVTARVGDKASLALTAKTAMNNSALRAYYGHGGNWTGWAQKNAKYVKQYGGKS